MSEDLTFIFKHPIELFMILFMVFVGIQFYNKNQIDDLTKNYAEITAITGGFTTSQYDDFIKDLTDAGFEPANTVITIKATAPDGTDISSKVLNVTPPKQNPYPVNPIYCPRGTKITLKVVSTKSSVLNNVYKFIGYSTNIIFGSSKRVYMSERVE